MSRTRHAVAAGREPVLRRYSDERDGTRRGFYRVRGLQMAAEPVRHGIFLGEERAHRQHEAGSVLLDSGGRRESLRLHGNAKSQDGGGRAALGFGRDGELL